MRARHSIITLMPAILIGLMLVGLGAPRLFAYAVRAPYDETLRTLGRERPVSDREVRAAIAFRERALDALGSGEIAVEIGMLYMELANRSGTSSQDWEMLVGRARNALLWGLVRSPVQPYAWAHLAMNRVVRARPADEVLAPLAMSVRTGPFESRLVVARAEFGLSAWAQLDNAARRIIENEVRQVARYEPKRLAQSARRLYALRRVRNILRLDPVLLRKFDQAYLERPR